MFLNLHFSFSFTLLKMGCSKIPLGHYALLVFKKRSKVALITRRAQCPKGVSEHPIFNSVVIHLVATVFQF